MKRILTLAAMFAFAFTLTADAQQVGINNAGIQNLRPYDQNGLNSFEALKQDTSTFQGMHVKLGGAFAQQFQSLSHSNEAAAVTDAAGKNLNQLEAINTGFNLATANLNLDVQLADGIRVNLITYLSSRHHSETWVKGGYFQIDRLPMFKSAAIDRLMEHVALKVGHFEVNYGDAHFRRTDNGNALYNPFVGNLIMDAFTTEIGGEVYVTAGPVLAMAAVTGGEIKGSVTGGEDRKPSFYGKVGFDNQLGDDLRVRLTGSAYTTASSLSNTLYSGDRAGSRYYLVMEAQGADITATRFSGMVNPGMSDKVTAFMINPFVKFHGLEVFGLVEQAAGRSAKETEDRTWSQYAVDALYRFLPNEQAYVGARYNVAKGALAGATDEVTIDRIAIGAGWFVTPNVLAKLEYVNQGYDGFASTDIRHGGRFNGLMIEGVVAF